MNQKVFKSFILLLTLGFVFTTKANTHKYHSTLTEIVYNHDSNKLEVGIKVSFEDLQQALKVEQDIIIDDPLMDFKEAITTHVSNHFTITSGVSQAVNLNFSHMKDEMDAVWIFFESDEITYSNQWKVKNTLFFNLFSQQVNYVNFFADKRNMKKVEGLLLSAQEKEGIVLFK